MVDNSFLQGAGGPRPVSGPGQVGPGSPASRPTTETGAAFKALLEKLEHQARDLAEVSENVDGPAELAGAVDSARSSLEDALSLSDRLLEAYRASKQAPTPPDSDGSVEGQS